MKQNEAFPSTFLKAADLDKPIEVTVKGAAETVTYPDKSTGRVIAFREIPKKLGLNKVNFGSLVEISGIDDDEGWDGVKVELFRTKVEMQAKMVDAVRIRPIGGWDNFQAPPKQEDNADVPF